MGRVLLFVAFAYLDGLSWVRMLRVSIIQTVGQVGYDTVQRVLSDHLFAPQEERVKLSHLAEAVVTQAHIINGQTVVCNLSEQTDAMLKVASVVALLCLLT